MSDTFGLTSPEGNPALDFLQDEPPKVEETQDQQPEEQVEPAGGGPETPAPEAISEEEAEEQVRRWAGKYENPDELERGYRELRDLQRRTAERAKAYEGRMQEIEGRARMLEQALRQAIPVVREAQARRNQAQQNDDWGNEEPTQPQGIPPEQLAPFVDRLVAQRLGQVDQRLRAQQSANQAQQQAASAMQGFFQNHPEVEPESDLDSDITNTIHVLNDAMEADGYGLDLTSPDVYEIAYEATKNPALRTVLAKNPSLIDDDEGMELARSQAAQLNGSRPNTQQRPPVGGVPVSQKKPVVESASGASPTPAEQDEWDKGVAAFKRLKDDSVFFT